jgi:hypothetical protein
VAGVGVSWFSVSRAGLFLLAPALSSIRVRAMMPWPIECPLRLSLFVAFHSPQGCCDLDASTSLNPTWSANCLSEPLHANPPVLSHIPPPAADLSLWLVPLSHAAIPGFHSIRQRGRLSHLPSPAGRLLYSRASLNLVAALSTSIFTRSSAPFRPKGTPSCCIAAFCRSQPIVFAPVNPTASPIRSDGAPICGTDAHDITLFLPSKSISALRSDSELYAHLQSARKQRHHDAVARRPRQWTLTRPRRRTAPATL